MGIFVLVWLVLARRVDNSVLLPSPDVVARSIAAQLQDGSLIQGTISSVSRLLLAYVVAVVIGIPLGVILGWWEFGRLALNPIVEVLRPISAIAWIPLALVVLGVGVLLPLFILVYVTIFPVILNTAAGIKAVRPALIKVSRTMGLSEAVIIWRVALPSALPSVLTGIRLSAGLGWMALIASELVGAPNGLGYTIQLYAGLFRTEDMIAVIVAVAVLGYCTDLVLRAAERKLTPWATA